MCKSLKWEPESKEKEEARDGVRDAIAKTFNAIYGTDENDLRSWHNLCRAVSIHPLPPNIQACREVRDNSYLLSALMHQYWLIRESESRGDLCALI